MIPFLDCPQSDDRIILSLLRSYLHCARIIDTRTNHAPAHVIPLHQTYARACYTPAPDVRPHMLYPCTRRTPAQAICNASATRPLNRERAAARQCAFRRREAARLSGRVPAACPRVHLPPVDRDDAEFIICIIAVIPGPCAVDLHQVIGCVAEQPV